MRFGGMTGKRGKQSRRSKEREEQNMTTEFPEVRHRGHGE
jgi:hypothetical protein